MNRFLIAAAIAAVVPFTAQPAGADSPQEMPAAFVRAFDAGPPALREYVRENLSAAAPAPDGGDPTREILAYQRALHSIRLADVRAARERIVANVQAQDGDWYQVALTPSPRGASLESIEMTLGVPPHKPGEDVAAYLRRISDAGYFSGTVLAARRDSSVMRAGYGLADRAARAANRPETIFNIGSIGKLFTRTAIQQLIDRGIVRESDTIARWLPDYPNDYASHVTVGELADMRSGIGDFFGERYRHTPKSKLRALRDYLPLFASAPLAFKPGSEVMYSNGGYIVLGLIVERASGEDYYTYVRRHIFEPAGMTHTGFVPLHEPLENRAEGYTRGMAPAITWNLPLQDALPLQPEVGSSAGGAYSTVSDLYAFSRALRDGTLLKERSPWVDMLKFVAGGSPGWNSALDVETASTVVVLSNQDPPIAMAVAQELRDLLAGR